MKKILFIFLLLNQNLFAQKLTIKPKNTYQTMHSFGASDCWSLQMVGKYYTVEKREKIAELLFSKEVDMEGNPKGIGLSMWRFNIGAGSMEQGINSKIFSEWRRSECFLGNGIYDWTKQEGQRWFLDASKRYNVDFTLGFLNSPPVSMTQNGTAVASGRLGEWNFKKYKIEDFTNFIVEVSDKYKFDYISPFNEPQWDWGPKPNTEMGSQEGTPINNDDIAWATRKIDEKIAQKNLKTHLVLAEAGMIDYLYKSKTNRSEVKQDSQIEDFFNKKSKNYIGNLKSVENLICGHSYFSTSPNNKLIQKRQELGAKIKKHHLNYWQSEYCVLGDNAGEIKGGGMDLSMKTALYVAKVIHADLTYANSSAWHWWLSVSANNYKDGLIFISNKGATGENDSNKFDGEILDSKLLWAFGNYSRFIRPNMQRIEANFENKNLLVSAYKSKNEIVVVLVNNNKVAQQIELPMIDKKQQINAFCTSKTDNLKLKKITKNKMEIPVESVVTLVINY